MLDLAAIKSTSRAADAPPQSEKKPVNGKSENPSDQEFQSAYESAADKAKETQKHDEPKGQASRDDPEPTDQPSDSGKPTADEPDVLVGAGEGQRKLQDGAENAKGDAVVASKMDTKPGRNQTDNALSGPGAGVPSARETKGLGAAGKPRAPAATGPETATVSSKETARKTPAEAIMKTPAEAIILSKAAKTGQRSSGEGASASSMGANSAEAAKPQSAAQALASIAKAEARQNETKKEVHSPGDAKFRPESSTSKAPAPKLAAATGMTLIAKPQILSVSESQKDKVDLVPVVTGDGDGFGSWETRSSTQVSSATLGQVLNRPETPSMIARQMAEALQKLPDRPVEISLNPKELGRVRMNISAAEAGITVSIVAERPETLDLMRRHIEQLTREFQSIGYENIAFAFAEGEQNSAYSEQQHEDGHADLSRLVIAEEEEAEPLQPMTSASNGIDIRL